MKRLLLFALFVAGALINSAAQSHFFKSKDAYLGQTPPGDKPEPFAEQLLAKNDTFPIGRVAFSQDGKEFYYASDDNWNDRKDTKIRYFKYYNGQWNGPYILNEHYDTPTFSMDDNTLYFVRGVVDRKYYVISKSKRQPGGGWSQPSVYITARHALYNFMPTASGTCYAGSRVPGDTSRRDMDICELKMSTGDTTIRSLGEPINTKGFDGDFYVAKDESYMIVSTKETKDFECELWISFHKADGSWTKMQSLGPEINDGLAHRFGQYVSPDGKYLFYTKAHSPKDCHLEWVRFDRLLNKLRVQAKDL
jgi:hypothetical protein